MSKQRIDENKLFEYNNNHWTFESFRSKIYQIKV